MKLTVSQIAIYGFSVLRVIFLLLLAFFLPGLFSYFSSEIIDTHITQPHFRLGIENLTDSVIKTFVTNAKKICLITDQTAITQEGKTTTEILLTRDMPINTIFYLDEQSQIKAIKSLANIYPSSKFVYIPEQQLTPRELKEFDLVLFDMQDGGTSAHITIKLLLKLIASSAHTAKTMVVFDRPNVMGGIIEGALCTLVNDNKMVVPLRHGMTIGEMAQLINHATKKQARLMVIPMENYHRAVDDLSPEYLEMMKHINSWYDTTFLYPLTFINPIETGYDALKMQCILLPETVKFNRAKWQELRVLLQDIGIDSSFHRCYNRQKKYYACGLRLFVKNIEHFSSLHALVTILKFFKRTGVTMTFSNSFDECIGTKKLRGFILGHNEWHEVEQDINKQLKIFFNSASRSLLYKPIPQLNLV